MGDPYRTGTRAGLPNRILALLFAAIHLCGLIMVHWPAGWFVVGLGRNGMEYSALLIAPTCKEQVSD